ncbi:methylenetetrahydrofolate dehydrogenase [Coprinopsis cinerea okayama7|uniref:Methylenetetrahydrofolate dehydrogenase n=1 Tax=Coprinopsis cinerea (strain Okayama-7 / 130 / ATCC MYA-4618 / FGSC 9003) TaxID=240176 RepID=A8NYT3_COPC7|nr:methylenetetrahydrofolate dehydrogenase [Coprinopsis cinerea okayama7\|eukprot:XP_001837516.1 methylenetetrahydrofolate dehydrogenase [Coprinopsis cinerea okayama7\
MTTPAAAGKGMLLKAEPIAAAFRDEVKGTLAQCSVRPKLVGILSTSSAPSKHYAEFTRKQCEELGVEFVLKKTGAALSAELGEGEGVEEAIIEANGDPSVHGIMVYYPIFGAQQDHYLQQVVSPLKDVEGLHFKFHYNLYHNIRFLKPESLLNTVSAPCETTSTIDGEVPPEGMVKSIIPCTPLAIVKCLEFVGVYNRILPYGDRAYGKTVTIINRSEVVGRPLAALLSNDGARVLSVDIDSIQEYTKRPRVTADTEGAQRYHPRHIVQPTNMTLQECLAVSDVVVSAVPSATYKVKTEWLKPGCICLNVAADKNFEANVREKASIYVPAVGKVTILMLLRNLLRLQQYQRVPTNAPTEASS